MEPRANSICNGKASASSGSDDFEDYDNNIMMIIIMMGCTKNPIRTKSHIWDFVHLYGIVFDIIVIIIITIMIIKSEGVNAQF